MRQDKTLHRRPGQPNPRAATDHGPGNSGGNGAPPLPSRARRRETGLERTWRWARVLCSLYLAMCLGVLSSELGLGAARPEIVVPYLIGHPQDQAIQMLQQRGLGVSIDIGQRNDGYRADAVMEQSIPPGVRVRQGRVIHLMICPGRLHVDVPNVRGMLVDDAVRTLVAAGLHPEEPTDTPSHTVPMDQIITQLPTAGARVELGSPIALVASDGPEEESTDDASTDDAPAAEPVVAVPGKGHSSPDPVGIRPRAHTQTDSSAEPARATHDDESAAGADEGYPDQPASPVHVDHLPPPVHVNPRGASAPEIDSSADSNQGASYKDDSNGITPAVSRASGPRGG